MKISQTSSSLLPTTRTTTGADIASEPMKRHPAATFVGFACLADADGTLAIERLRLGGNPTTAGDWREVTSSDPADVGLPGGRLAVVAGEPATYLGSALSEVLRVRYRATAGVGTVSEFEGWYSGHGVAG